MPDQSQPRNTLYEIFILTLSLASLVLLAIDGLATLTPSAERVLALADNGVCLIFFIDFIYQFATARQRWRYFKRGGWLDLVSSVPAVSVFRLARASRIVRILRVLRGVRATRLIAVAVNKRAESTVLGVTLITLLVILIASLAIIQFENVSGANIRSAEDAVLWSVSTVMSAGYSDRFPVSPEGRVIGALLMICGTTVLGVVAAGLAAWFLDEAEKKNEDAIASLREEIKTLRETIQERLPRQQ